MRKGTLEDIEQRPEVHVEDPRERAKVRAQEILDHIGTIDDATDEFYIPENLIPDGWSWEWKTYSVFGQTQDTYLNERRRFGWDFVDASRVPDMVPLGCKDKIVLRKGVVLMERPKEVTDLIADREKKKARDQVRIKEQQLNEAPPGTFDRANKDAPLARVKKSWSPLPIPE
jgi:hypothetical protein